MRPQPTERPVPKGAPSHPGLVHRYQLVDLAGRELGAIEQRVPPRQDETIVLDEAAWRIVAVLGRSVTVVRAERRGAADEP